MEFEFDSDPIEPTPTLKKGSLPGLYPPPAASPPRGKETAASLPNGARDRAEIRTAPRTRSHSNRAPPCGPSTVACSASGEHVRRREGTGRSHSSSPSATEDGCCCGSLRAALRDEREGEGENEPRVSGGVRPGRVFIRPKSEENRRSEINGHQRIGPHSAQAG